MSSENYLNDEKNITINFMKSNYTNINVSKNKFYQILIATHCYFRQQVTRRVITDNTTCLQLSRWQGNGM